MAHPPPEFPLPAMGEVVDLPTIQKICAHYGLHVLWRKIERDPPPLPFKSDGCTGWVNEWKGVSLYPAGFLHDLKYWAGYPGEDVERLIADAELMIDVARCSIPPRWPKRCFMACASGVASSCAPVSRGGLVGTPERWRHHRLCLPAPRARHRRDVHPDIADTSLRAAIFCPVSIQRRALVSRNR